jgi:nucleotide-binding universal stress UspA family protein
MKAVIALERILCPVDFSEFSAGAAAHAGALARHCGARLTFLHVAWVQVPPSSFGAAPGPLLLDEAALQGLEDDLRAFARTRVDPSVAAEVRVVQGAAANEILGVASEMAASLIVLGTHGRSGFERLMLGSTAEKVLRKATCPVLTVPRAAGAAGPPHELVLFESIIYATDFSEGARAALPWALSLARESKARLAMLHVLDWPDMPGEGKPFAATLTSARDEWLEQLRSRLRTAVPAEARAALAVDDVLATGAPYKEILRVAAERQADLIVLGVQGRGAVDLRLFGSTTSEVLRRAACPVLTVRAG